MKIKAGANALLLMAQDRQSLGTFGDICLPQQCAKRTLCYTPSAFKKIDPQFHRQGLSLVSN